MYQRVAFEMKPKRILIVWRFQVLSEKKRLYPLMSNDDNYTVATNEIEFCPTVKIQTPPETRLNSITRIIKYN